MRFVSFATLRVVRLFILLRDVDEITAEDQRQEADVQRRDQFLGEHRALLNSLSSPYLTMNVNDTAEQTPRSSVPIDVQHTEDLQESNTTDSRSGKRLSIGGQCDHQCRGNDHDQI